MRYIKPTQKAEGFKRTKGHRRIALSIPEDVFAKIKRRAEFDEVPFTVEAVALIRDGLGDLEAKERHEPYHPL
jgi:hypothetical protein